ncbi:hypothetical protein [Nocardia wallacei]|uniref:hypothetical protein n=1 Tax=Nocardia wallacei TaxID=480035 RepID=UPI002458F6E0|nr:hypothetical protein [Nocardia wallacei]
MLENNARARSPLLPWPSEWGSQRPPGKLVAGLVVFGAAAIVAIPYVIVSGKNGNTVGAVSGFAGGLVALSFVAIFAPHMRVRRTKLPRDIHSDDDGLRILYLSSWAYVVMGWLAAAVAFLLMRGALFLVQLSERDDSGDATIRGAGLATVLVASVMAVSIIWYLISGKHRRGTFVLGQDGVLLAFGGAVRNISWDELGDVSPCIVNNSRVIRITPAPGSVIHVQSGRSLLDRLQRSYHEQNMDLHSWVMGIDPSLLLHLVRYYWQNPDVRQELISEAVIERVLRGELVS